MSDIFGGPPDDPGDIPYDRYGEPEDYADFMRDDPGDYSFWWGGHDPEPWWYQQIELQNDSGEVISLTGAQWFEATTMDPELADQLYGLEPLDIIHQLQGDYEIWDSEDWDTWREWYNEQ